MKGRRRVKDERMTLVQHLEEFRRRLIWVALAMGVATVVAWSYAPLFFEYLIQPVGRVVYLDVSEGFFVRLRLAAYMGAMFSFPVLLYHVLAFVLPALGRGERRSVLLLLPVFLTLFLVGLGFAWFIFFPFTVRFFLGFVQNGTAEPLLSADRYISFVLGFVVPFGLVFELPLITAVLSGLGLVSPRFLTRRRKYAVLIIAVLAMILTPPDVVSMIAMGLPMVVLYEFGIILAKLAWRRRGRLRPAE